METQHNRLLRKHGRLWLHDRERRVEKMKSISINELKTKRPDLVSRIEAVARDKATRKKVAEAVKGERDRCVKFAKIHFGEKAGERFESIVESGLTPEQFKAAKGAFSGPSTAAGPINAEEKWKADFMRSQELQDKFGTAERYSAFMKAKVDGRVKMLSKKKVVQYAVTH